MKDTAYTSEFLEPHTDNTYFTEPAGLQALHLLSHTSGAGGASSLTDGLHAAVRLFAHDPAAYRTLASVGVYAHASGNAGISVQPARAFPVLGHDPDHGFLTQVRWNNADRAGVAGGFGEVERWYAAAAKFEAILSRSENQYWFQLRPGQTLLFDNWRVLHGRSEFTGKRRMCGGYINRDDFISRFRMTNLGEEDIKFSTVSG
jgi:trimethyllysine dioxygenase